ncbi:MAG: AIR synthase-related protein [Anaerolineales bacterium]
MTTETIRQPDPGGYSAQPLPYAGTPYPLFKKIRHLPLPVLLASGSDRQRKDTRFEYITAAPDKVLRATGKGTRIETRDGEETTVEGNPLDILAREFPQRLGSLLTTEELQQAADFLHTPGIGVSRDARIACAAGEVTAMHDPTEGGLAAALWEMAEACGHTLVIDSSQVHVPELSARICAHFGLEPLNTIASGALLLAVKENDAEAVQQALATNEIRCSMIGQVAAGKPRVEDIHRGAGALLPWPARDEITTVYE